MCLLPSFYYIKIIKIVLKKIFSVKKIFKLKTVDHKKFVQYKKKMR